MTTRGGDPTTALSLPGRTRVEALGEHSVQNLRDKLLKAGLVTAEQAEKAATEPARPSEAKRPSRPERSSGTDERVGGNDNGPWITARLKPLRRPKPPPLAGSKDLAGWRPSALGRPAAPRAGDGGAGRGQPGDRFSTRHPQNRLRRLAPADQAAALERRRRWWSGRSGADSTPWCWGAGDRALTGPRRRCVSLNAQGTVGFLATRKCAVARREAAETPEERAAADAPERAEERAEEEAPRDQGPWRADTPREGAGADVARPGNQAYSGSDATFLTRERRNGELDRRHRTLRAWIRTAPARRLSEALVFYARVSRSSPDYLRQECQKWRAHEEPKRFVPGQ
jgi:hypothetical protein